MCIRDRTRFWLTPQLLQAHSSYVVVDPKGGTLDQCGRFLQREKYRVRDVYKRQIKHQGSRTSGQIDPKDAGKRSNEIVAERNKMAVKPVSYTHLVSRCTWGHSERDMHSICDCIRPATGNTGHRKKHMME